MSRYTFKNGLLTETLEDRVITYQGWTAGLVVEVLDLSSRRTRPYLPQDKLFNDDGSIADSHTLDVSTGTEVNDQDPSLSRAALEQYAEEFPEAVRCRSGRFIHNQWVALEAFRHVEGFSEFFDTEPPNSSLPYIQAVWAAGDVAILEREDRLSLTRSLIKTPKVELLGSLLKLQLDQVFIDVITRSIFQCANKDYLVSLHAAFQDQTKAPLLSQLSDTQPFALDLLAYLPPWLRQPKVFGLLFDDLVDPYQFDEFVPWYIVDAPVEKHDAILQSLHGVKDSMDIYDCLEKWVITLAPK